MKTALRKIAADVNNVHVEEEIVTLWLEYENSSSPEAVLAHQLDKLEMILQANEYEESQNVNLEDFFQSTKDSFSHPEVREFVFYCIHT
jgi:putative hydrolases of HD superfamily